jgi:hypothetical protein
VEVVEQRSGELLARYDLPARVPAPMIEMLTTVFREIREGKTTDGISIKKSSTALSTAEAISIAMDAALYAKFFGKGPITARHIARNLVGSVVKENVEDLAALKEYVAIVAKKRALTDDNWKEFHDEMLISAK